MLSRVQSRKARSSVRSVAVSLWDDEIHVFHHMSSIELENYEA